MVQIETLESVLALFQDPELQEKAEELGRFFFSNGSVTINLLPIITFTFLAALLAVPLLLPAFDALSSVYSSAAGYSNSVAYSSNNYGPPGTGYGYSARSSLIELSDEQKALYPEITDLRAKIEKLQEDEYNIRSQIYYGGGSGGGGGTANYDTTNSNSLAQPYSY